MIAFSIQTVRGECELLTREAGQSHVKENCLGNPGGAHSEPDLQRLKPDTYGVSIPKILRYNRPDQRGAGSHIERPCLRSVNVLEGAWESEGRERTGSTVSSRGEERSGEQK